LAFFNPVLTASARFDTENNDEHESESETPKIYTTFTVDNNETIADLEEKLVEILLAEDFI